MIFKKNIIFPIILGVSSTSLLLTSCAQVSQYEPRVVLNIDDDLFKVNVTENGSSVSKPKYSTIIGGQLSIQKQTSEGKWENANVKEEIYFLPLSVNVIYPLITLTNKLVNVSHIPSQFGDSNSLFSNNLVFENNNNLKEFLYASSNTLNQGRKNQIRLYLSEMNLKAISTDTSKKLIDITSEKTLEVEKKEIKLKKNDKKDFWIYDISTMKQKKLEDSDFVNNNEYTIPYSGKAYESSNTKTFDVSFKYNYYSPEDTNIYKSPLSDLNVIKNYVNENNAWNGFQPTKTSFEIKLNIQVQLRAEYSFSNYLEVDKGKEPIDKNKLVAVTKSGSNGSEKYEVKLEKKDENDKDKKYYVNFSNFGVSFKPNGKTSPFLDDLKNNTTENNQFKDNSSILLNWLKEDKLPTSFYITSESQQKDLVEKIKKFKDTLSVA